MISVITPHYAGTNQYIGDCYRSLREQTYEDWQWVIVLNNGGALPPLIYDDERVKTVPFDSEKLGALKRAACENANGEMIAELDVDDMLLPNALEEVCEALNEAPFAYSNSARFKPNWESPHYSEYWGWKHRPFKYNGYNLNEMVAFPATPHSMRLVDWAPNHIRAWRAKDYWEVGGHNPEMPSADDHDLCCRFYLHGQMQHIDKCLYLYREHENNTCSRNNVQVRQGTWRNYAKYVVEMAVKWARENGLEVIDLGAAHNKPKGFLGLDRSDSDISCDLNEGIPFDDGEVGVVRAVDILEHLDPVRIMNEIYRVLAPGGWLAAAVPSTDGRGAFQDPSHTSFWNENSFWYYTNPEYAKYVPDVNCRFQVSRVITWFPSNWCRQHNIPYVDAQLIAVKDGFRAPGEILWPS
jgi:glycosyltransferase involved in cell wall biosynthesis